MREEGNGDDEPHALPVTTGLPESRPSNVGNNVLVEVNGGLNLLELVSHKGVVLVTIGMVVGQGLESLLIPALANEPTWRLRREPNKANLGDSGETLQHGRDTPRPSVLDLEGSEGSPGGDDSTGVPEGVVHGSDRRTVSGVRAEELFD